ncbi:hypothetical protein BHJ80_22095 [Escherichia coli]|nr:hypothetical protein BHJ80_22095 [Escherichia coli]
MPPYRKSVPVASRLPGTSVACRIWSIFIKVCVCQFQTPLIPDLHDAAPFVNETGSDSSSMDNMLELLLAGGMDTNRRFRACLSVPFPPGRTNLI